MKLVIYAPQPFQDLLCRQTIEYIEKNFDREEFGKPQIYRADGQPFGYVIKDGHHRLFACHRLGIKRVDVELVRENMPKSVLEAAVELYKKKIRSVKGLQDCIRDEFECKLILMACGGL